MENPPFEDVFPIVKERILKPVMFVFGVLQMDVLNLFSKNPQKSNLPPREKKPCNDRSS